MSLERFDRWMGPSDRLLGALAFLQANGPLRQILLIYDTRSRTIAAAVAYSSEVPVALLRFLEQRVGPPEYIQTDRGMPLIGVARASRVLHGGYVFDGLSLTADASVWREAVPRPA